MGKTTKTKVELPDPSDAELRNQSLLGSLIEAQLDEQGYSVSNSRNAAGEPVTDIFLRPQERARRRERQTRLDSAESSVFDAFDKLIAGDYSFTGTQQAQINTLIQASGLSDFSLQNDLKGELGSAVSGSIGVVGDITSGYMDRLSAVADKGVGEVREIAQIGVNEQHQMANSAVNELKVLFASSEEAVNAAVDRLTEAGNIQIAERMTLFRREVDDTAARLGRSSADSTFTTEVARTEAQANKELYALGQTEIARNIANLRAQLGSEVGDIRTTEMQDITSLRGAEIGGVSQIRSQEVAGTAQLGSAGISAAGGLANTGLLGLQVIQQNQLAQQGVANTTRLQLLANAAQPYNALSSGGQYTQLANALNTQALANNIATSGVLGNQLQRQLQERAAQPTTTQTTPFNFGSLFGGLAGLAGNIFSSGLL